MTRLRPTFPLAFFVLLAGAFHFVSVNFMTEMEKAGPHFCADFTDQIHPVKYDQPKPSQGNEREGRRYPLRELSQSEIETLAELPPICTSELPGIEFGQENSPPTQPIVPGTHFNDFLPWKRPETIADQTEDVSLTPVENRSPTTTEIEQWTRIAEQYSQGKPVDDSQPTLKSGKQITVPQPVGDELEPSAGPFTGNDEVSPPAPEMNQSQPTNTDGLALSSLPAQPNGPACDDFLVEQPPVSEPWEDDTAPRVANATPATQLPEPALLIDEAPQGTPCLLQCASNFVLAAEPESGVHWKDDRRITDNCSQLIVDPIREDFSPDSIDLNQPPERVPPVASCETQESCSSRMG